MSSFIVEPDCINRILSLDRISRFTDFNKLLKKIFSSEDKTAIGKMLLDLNEGAFDHRYNYDNTGEISKNVSSYKYKEVKTSLLQAYQSACCLSYQCCEGEAENSEAYKQLNRFIDVLARRIADNETDKVELKWG